MMINRILRLFGYRRTFGARIAPVQKRRPVSDEEAKEIQERQRIDRASIYA